MTQRRYVSVADTAKLIRAQLKINFPGVVFSVRSKSYSGGASINVGWTDGPLTKQVEEVAKVFQGSQFDGMTDSSTTLEAWLLPDGSATFARRNTEEGAFYVECSTPGAERVRFGADFVFCDRDYSAEMWLRALDKVCLQWGVDKRELRLSTSKYSGKPLVEDLRVDGANEYIATLIHRDLVRRTNYLKAKAREVVTA